MALVSPVVCNVRIPPITLTRLLLLRDGSFCIDTRTVSLNSFLIGGYKNPYTNTSRISATYRNTYKNISMKGGCFSELNRKTQCMMWGSTINNKNEPTMTIAIANLELRNKKKKDGRLDGRLYEVTRRRLVEYWMKISM